MLSNKTVPRLSIDPFSDGFLADPYAHHDLLRDAGPVFWLECHGIYGAARHVEVSAALKDWRNFCSGRGVGLDDFAVEKPWRPPSLLLETDPPVHDRTRGLMNSVVALPGLKALTPLWLTKAEALADRLVAQRHFDAVADLAEAYPLSIFPDTIGMTEEGRENLLVYARAIFNAFGPRNALFTETDRAARDAVPWVSHACQRENLKPGWGMAVYEQSDAGKCNAEEAHLLVRSFLSAGVDTTVTGIANMIYAFALYPDQWRMLRSNPSQRRKAFEEALRWDSPSADLLPHDNTRRRTRRHRAARRRQDSALPCRREPRPPPMGSARTLRHLPSSERSRRLWVWNPSMPRPDGGKAGGGNSTGGAFAACRRDPSGGRSGATPQQHTPRVLQHACRDKSGLSATGLRGWPCLRWRS